MSKSLRGKCRNCGNFIWLEDEECIELPLCRKCSSSNIKIEEPKEEVSK